MRVGKQDREKVPRGYGVRFLLLGLAVAILLVAAYFAAPSILGDGLSGGAIVARRVDDRDAAFELDEARTRAEFPALARLLDEAVEHGRAEDSDEDLRKDGPQYLDRVVKEETGIPLSQPPHNGIVGWRGAALEVYAWTS